MPTLSESELQILAKAKQIEREFNLKQKTEQKAKKLAKINADEKRENDRLAHLKKVEDEKMAESVIKSKELHQKFSDEVEPYLNVIGLFLNKIESLEANIWINKNREQLDKFFKVFPKLKKNLEEDEATFQIKQYLNVQKLLHTNKCPFNWDMETEILNSVHSMEYYILKLAETFKDNCIHPAQYKRLLVGEISTDNTGGYGMGYNTYSTYTAHVCGLCGHYCSRKTNIYKTDEFSDYLIQGVKVPNLCRIPFKLPTVYR